MTRATYLVTGGAGFLGAALVARLLGAGHRVRVLDNESRGSAARLRELAGDWDLVTADVRDAAAVRRAIRGVDAVCHLAFVNGTGAFYREPELVLEVGVKGMVNVIDACLEEGVGELVVASSSEVYQTPPAVPTDEAAPLSIPDPLNPRYSYAAGKIISEILTLNYGRRRFRRVVVFRPHNVYGPDMGWDHVIPQFALRMRTVRGDGTGPVPFPIQGSGSETRAFVFIDDFVDGLMLLIDRGEHLGIYNVGTTEEVSIAMVAREVGRYFGRDVAIVPGPLAPGSPTRRCPDVRKLAVLGYRPKVAFRDGLPRVLEWYDKHAGARPPAGREGDDDR